MFTIYTDEGKDLEKHQFFGVVFYLYYFIYKDTHFTFKSECLATLLLLNMIPSGRDKESSVS